MQLRASENRRFGHWLGDSGDWSRIENDTVVIPFGRFYIFPSTNISKARLMHQEIDDFVAIANNIGHPNFFVTITCNPNLSGTRRVLLPVQVPQERPNVAVGVFMMMF